MTIFKFKPTPSSLPFKFLPTLDGSTYSGNIWWNIQGQRCYLTVTTLTGTVIFTLPLIESPNDNPISITKNYFNSILAYYPELGQIVVTP